MNYLRRRQELWNALIDHADKAFPEDNRWFWNNYVLTYEIKTSQPVIRFFLSNFGDAGKTADQTIDDIYEKMFMPLYQRFGETDEGYRNACAAFIQMIFYGDTNVQREELSQIKDEIKKLARDFPEYEYVSPIKMFYQECLQLNDYIADSSDDYSQTKEQISNYEQRRRELRSLFDFDFSWTDHPADTIASLNGIYFEFFHQEEETAYQAAEAEAKRGNLFEALELYTKLGSYKESAVRAETIKAELYIKAQEYEQAGDLRSASRYMNAVHPYKDSGERLDYYRSVLGYPMTIKGYKAIGSLFFEDRAAVQNKEGKWDLSILRVNS